MPHCVICDSRNEPQLLKGRFFCADCRNDLAAVELSPKKYDAMLEYLRLGRQKNEQVQAEEKEYGGLSQFEVALAQQIIRRVNHAKRS